MNKVFILLGPTASGKSKLSLKLSRDYPFEIINADLYSIYKGLNIGTAKPSDAELKITKHYLIDTIQPNIKYNVSNFCADVDSSIKIILSKNKYPLIVGGTMMYVYQLLNGLSNEYDLLESDKKLIKFIQKKYSSSEIHNAFQSDTLVNLDKINCNDNYRIEKLLERSVGSANQIKKYRGLYSQSNMTVNIIFIDIKDRELLRTAISDRAKEMIKSGLVKEVQQLVTNFNLTQDNQSMKAIGYKETIDYLNNKSDLKDLIEKITLSTQQLAKRQLTWRNKFAINFKVNFPDINYGKLCKFITKSLQ
tara:strand:- start:2379 stop:3296 length:918 start_codon:yes stop_codon:yes gene_type:complete